MVPTIKRAYGDWTTSHLAGWKEELLRHAIQPVQQLGADPLEGRGNRLFERFPGGVRCLMVLSALL